MGTFCRCWQKVPRRRQNRKCGARGLRIATGAERPRNDMVFGKGCGETGRPGGRPLRVHGKGGRARATARVAPTGAWQEMRRVLCLRGRRRGYPCSTKAARAGVSGQRMAAQRRCESTAVDLRTWFAGRSASAWDMPQARKDFKTMGFGGVLWVLSAAVGRKRPAGGT